MKDIQNGLVLGMVAGLTALLVNKYTGVAV